MSEPQWLTLQMRGDFLPLQARAATPTDLRVVGPSLRHINLHLNGASVLLALSRPGL